jgi:hypothetical protein
MLAVLLGAALAAVVDADGAVTVVVTGGAVGEWQAEIPAMAAAPMNAANGIRVGISLL